jgi:predicted transcriptional regulator
MKRKPLKTEILNLIVSEYPNWVAGYRVERLAGELHFMASCATRRARELETSGAIEKIYDEKKRVMYRYRPQIVFTQIDASTITSERVVEQIKLI